MENCRPGQITEGGRKELSESEMVTKGVIVMSFIEGTELEIEDTVVLKYGL